MLHDLLTYSNEGGSDAPGQMSFTKTFFPAKTLICFTHHTCFIFYFCRFFFLPLSFVHERRKILLGTFCSHVFTDGKTHYRHDMIVAKLFFPPFLKSWTQERKQFRLDSESRSPDNHPKKLKIFTGPSVFHTVHPKSKKTISLPNFSACYSAR